MVVYTLLYGETIMILLLTDRTDRTDFLLRALATRS